MARQVSFRKKMDGKKYQRVISEADVAQRMRTIKWGADFRMEISKRLIETD